jgi:hypothetical protein
MTPLPLCRWRGERMGTGHYPCHSTALVTPVTGVHENTCRTCPYCDHEPLPPAPKIEMKQQQRSAKEMIERFLRALAYEMTWRAKGGREPTAEEKAARRALCDPCQYRAPALDRCTICGCFLERRLLHLPPIFLGKLDCATQSCPLGYWGTVAGAPAAGCR